MRHLFGMAAICALSGALPASAHHSLAAYNMGTYKTVEGTVKSFQWMNPHAKLSLVFTDLFNVIIGGRKILVAVFKTNFGCHIQGDQARDLSLNRAPRQLGIILLARGFLDEDQLMGLLRLQAERRAQRKGKAPT